MEKLDRIRYLIIDVDGTMTDAGIYYDENGNETKKFCTKDAAGFFAARQVGIKILVLTGRACYAVERRMKELKVDYLEQNVRDKIAYLNVFLKQKGVTWEEVGYIGDDLNDLGGMCLAGFAACPADACEEVKKISDYISEVKGGYGAVRDIICFLLQERKEWEEAILKIYGAGV